MFDVPILGDIVREVGATVRELVPDADKRMDVDLAFAQLADKAAERETALLSGQIEVNKTEAASGNLFVAGWRPFIGWTSGFALAYTWIVAPVLKPLFHLTELPIIDPSQIYPIVLAMLGVAGMRTYEKVQGVAAGTTQLPVPIASDAGPQNRSLPSKSPRIKWFK